MRATLIAGRLPTALRVAVALLVAGMVLIIGNVVSRPKQVKASS